MKEYLKEILRGTDNQILRRCLIREYLQARMLQSLQDSGTFGAWAFQGGTALRFLFSLPRFSEYLDFALVQPKIDDNFRGAMENVKNLFQSENYDVAVKINDNRIVKYAFIGFKGLLFEFGLSSRKPESISIKLDIDTNPPLGAAFTSTIVRRHVTLNLRHYDKSSLLAGKLHAVLARRYLKGRDIYDLIWYLADKSWPAPNVEFLNNALGQSKWTGPEVTNNNWRQLIGEKLKHFNWAKIADDVSPFLENAKDVQLLTKGNLLKLLK